MPTWRKIASRSAEISTISASLRRPGTMRRASIAAACRAMPSIHSPMRPAPRTGPPVPVCRAPRTMCNSRIVAWEPLLLRVLRSRRRLRVVPMETRVRVVSHRRVESEQVAVTKPAARTAEALRLAVRWVVLPVNVKWFGMAVQRCRCSVAQSLQAGRIRSAVEKDL